MIFGSRQLSHWMETLNMKLFYSNQSKRVKIVSEMFT